MKKRVLSILLILTMIIGLVPFSTVSVQAAGTTLAQLEAKYPHGKYWNGGNANSYTSSPCNHHGSCSYSGSCGCNTFKGHAIQCMGFAYQLAYLIYGGDPYVDWTPNRNASALNSLKAGDVVRYKNDGHSIFVTAVNGDTVTYADCNSDGYCKIRWNQTVSKATLKSTFTYVDPAPYEWNTGTTHTHSYSITEFEAVHPHREYKKCTCGEYQYTGKNIYLSGCSSCNASCNCSTSHAGGYVCTTSSATLTIRSGHGTSYSAIGSIPSGAMVSVSKASGSSSSDWAHVTYNGITGYASMQYLSKKVYTVTYNANGGTGAPVKQTKTHGVELKLSTTKPTRTGYTFLGWSTSKTATSATYKAGGSFKGNANTTLYAVWKLNTYTITYDANGGTGAPGKQTKNHGVDLTLNTTKPTRTGYTFLGWSTSKTATSATYKAGGSFTGNANTTLYAVWKLNPYTITYDANGGTGAPNKQTKTHGVDLTLSSTKPKKTGYTFLGWSTSKTATSATYKAGGKFTSNANTTLYAVWKANTYTISYNANGGSGTMSNSSHTYDVSKALSSNAYTRSGYTFLGWATGSSATTAAYTNGQSVKNLTSANKATVVLYAVWKQGCENGTHTYSYTVTKVPTISASGTLTGTCSKCSGTTTITLPKLNTTDYSYSVRTAATCTGAGSGRYTWKTTTYGSFYFDVSISATGHNYSSGRCTRCGANDPNHVIDQNAPMIMVDTVNGKAGETVKVTVSMKNNPGIWGMDLVVNYDKTQLTLASVTNGTVFSSSEWTQGNLSGDKCILSYEASGLDNITTNGVLAALEFAVNKNATVDSFVNISLSYNAGDIINVNFDDVKVAIVPGGINIADFVYGDLNSDGLVNKKDSLLMKMYLADNTTTIDMQAADVYVDGNINKKDSLYLKQYLAGLDVELGA